MASVLKAKTHYGYYLTMVGDSKTLPHFDKSVQMFESVTHDQYYPQLHEDDRCFCHWLFLKILVRTSLAINWDNCSLSRNDILSKALDNWQKINKSTDPFFVAQSWIWLAELITKFPKIKNRRFGENFLSILGSGVTPTVRECIDQVEKHCNRQDFKVLARIAKLCLSEQLRATDPMDAQKLYEQTTYFSNASLSIKWNIVAATTANTALNQKWHRSFVQERQNDLMTRLEQLKMYAKYAPWSAIDYMHHRALRDDNEDRQFLLTMRKENLEKIVAVSGEYKIRLAQILFTLGGDFGEIQALFIVVIVEQCEWQIICDAYQLWGFCCQENGDQAKAERLYNQVLSMASHKKYKPEVAAQEMECIIKERLQEENLDEKAKENLAVKLSAIYRVMEWKQVTSQRQVKKVNERFNQCAPIFHSAEEPFALYNYAEYLLSHKEAVSTKTFVDICLETASSAETGSWFFYAKIIHLCLDKISNGNNNLSIDILFFHSDGMHDAVCKLVTKLQTCSIQAASLLDMKAEPITALIKNANYSVVLLTDDYLNPDDVLSTMPDDGESDLISKILIMYSREEHLEFIPKHLHSVKLCAGYWARDEFFRLLALRLISELGL